MLYELLIPKMLFNNKEKKKKYLSSLIYKKIIVQARKKKFYSKLEVPDTLDGRFELIVLHLFFLKLVINKNDEKENSIFDSLVKIMFDDFDMNLRELGVGDLSVGKKIYQMSEAISGRFKAYEKGIDSKQKDVAVILKRNVYGTCKKIDSRNLNMLVDYFKDSIKFVQNIKFSDISEKSDIFLNLEKFIISKG